MKNVTPRDLAICVPLLFLSACGGEAPPRAASASAPAIPVRTVEVQRTNWPSVYEATGTVRARNSTNLSSKVMAYVQSVDVQLGEVVTAGKLLATLEVHDLDAAVHAAEASRTEVQSAIPEADNGIAAAKAQLDLAQSTFRRMQELASKKSISEQEFDEASGRVKAAQAAYEMVRGRRSQLDSRMAQAEQAVRSAGVMKEYARITAPFAGIVTAKSAEPGTLATPGAPLFTIEREGAWRLEASVDESRLAALRGGQSVDIAIGAPEQRLHCRIAEIVPAVDAASRSALVKIDLPAGNWRSGMFGRALFPQAARQVMSIPTAALTERGQLQSVFVVEEGTARTRLVSVGQRTGEALEVLSGLTAGEKVVALIPAALRDGGRIEVRP